MAATYHSIDQHTGYKDETVVESSIVAEDRKEGSSRWRSSTVTITAGAVTALLVLGLNVGLLVYVELQFDVKDGVAAIYEGTSAKVSTFSTYSHLLINILSTLLLGASNACAQLLVAPTRSDIDSAHAKNLWLDIGVPSFRNLNIIHGFRKAGWIVLMMSSIPLHLLYNSVLFSTSAGHYYQAALVSPEFLDAQRDLNGTRIVWQLGNDVWGDSSGNVHVFWNTRNLALQGKLTKLNKRECLHAYAASGDIETDKGNLLVVVKDVMDSMDRRVLAANETESLLGLFLHSANLPFNDLAWACGMTRPQDQQKPPKVDNAGIQLATSPDSNANPKSCRKQDLQPAYKDNEAAWTISNVRQCDLVACEMPTCDSWALTCVGGSSECRNGLEYYAQSCRTVTIEVDYCLAESYQGKCAAKISTPLLALVVGCNIVKVLVFCGTAWVNMKSFKPLVTIGDAVKSFLREPEAEARGHGPLSVTDVVAGPEKRIAAAKERKREQRYRGMDDATYEAVPRPYASEGSEHGDIRGLSRRYEAATSDRKSIGIRDERRSGYWYHAASVGRCSRWTLCLISSIIPLTIAAILVTRVFKESENTSIKDFASSGTIGFTASASLASNIVIPNVPQLLVSPAYVFYNNAITSMLVAHETSQFALKRKFLRVSDPQGAQKSTYWLSLPYRYSIPLLVAMTMMHWLISRSIFFKAVEYYLLTGEQGDSSAAVEYSLLPLVLACSLGACLIVVFLGLSLRRLGRGMPLLGSCSIAISAACANGDGGPEAAEKALMYGVLTTETDDHQQGTKRVGFSPFEVGPLEKGVEYLQLTNSLT